MKLLSILLFIGIANGSASLSFQEERASAIAFLSANAFLIEAKANRYAQPTEEVLAVVFPELIRYDIVKDLIETKVLEQAYINNGSNKVDFSIGRFQMKISFIEKLEEAICASSSLQQKYEELVSFSSEENRRKERMERLKQFEFQLDYAFSFFEIMQAKNLRFRSKEDQLTWFASAYNYGFWKTPKSISAWSKVKAFPYGKYSEEPQEAYADFALWYFLNKDNK